MTWTAKALVNEATPGSAPSAHPGADGHLASAVTPAVWQRNLALAVFLASLLVGMTAWRAFAMTIWWEPSDYGEGYFRELIGSYLGPGLSLAVWPLLVLAAAMALVLALRSTRSSAAWLSCAAAVIAATHLGFTVHWTLEAERMVTEYAGQAAQVSGPPASPDPLHGPEETPDAVGWVDEQRLDPAGSVTALSKEELAAGVDSLRVATLGVMVAPIPNLMVGTLDAPPEEVACVPGGETGDVPDEHSASGTAYVLTLSLSGPDTITDEQNIIELWQERGLTYDRAMGTNYAGGPVSQAIDQVRMRGDAQGWLNITITSHCAPDEGAETHAD
ncbi:hypothetical protein [Pseudoclavibacter sp. 8L]|uniref:hypothetical protein n=1 Tax=Pseudoclavibacter sp. 8L TaxID=2653162 RepID=UPI0012F18A7A|nr:hypothetical protein [Pseudoclavibacter sp. 8L]VXB00003.1 conserved membrane hypothetical protein [Pseudoclavibacter sp. 8L]